MPDISDDLAILALVVGAGGFTAASRQCGVAKSQLSRRVAALERRFGLRLIDRSSRRFQVTSIGFDLARHGAAIRTESEAALDIARSSLQSPRGPLRVACPVVLAELVVGAVAADFACRHEAVQLTFDVTDGIRDLTPDNYDIVLRASPHGWPDSDLVARRLLLTPYELVASPAWIAAAGHPAGPDDLKGRDGVGWWQVTGAPRWRIETATGDSCDLSIRPRFQTNNLIVARTAAVAGLGMARLPRPLCADDLDQGHLRRVLEAWAPSSMGIYAVYPSRRSLSVTSRSFLADLKAAIDAWSATQASGRPMSVV